MPSSSSTIRILSVTPAPPPGPKGRGNQGSPSSGVPAKSRISWGGSRPPPCGRRLGVGGNNPYGPAKPGLPAASIYAHLFHPPSTTWPERQGEPGFPLVRGPREIEDFVGWVQTHPCGCRLGVGGNNSYPPHEIWDFAGTPDAARQSRAYPRRQFMPTHFTPAPPPVLNRGRRCLPRRSPPGHRSAPGCERC